MVIQQGEVWWAELLEPVGSGPGFRRPVLVLGVGDRRRQTGDRFALPLSIGRVGVGD